MFDSISFTNSRNTAIVGFIDMQFEKNEIFWKKKLDTYKIKTQLHLYQFSWIIQSLLNTDRISCSPIWVTKSPGQYE